MSALPVGRTIFDAVAFPVRNFSVLVRRIGIAVLLSFAGTLSATMLQGDSGSLDPTNGYSWLVLVAALIGSLMIINGAIQVYLQHPLAGQFWSLGSRELSQIGVFVLLLVLAWGCGLLVLLAYWGLSLALPASLVLQALDSNGAYLLGAILGLPVALLVAMRLAPLPAYIADKDQFAVEASWEATRGYFWRVFVCLIAVALFYGVLWSLGVVVGGFVVVSIIDGAVAQPSDTANAWISANLHLLVWPFTLYGQISVCALLGAIYKVTTGARNATAEVDVATGTV